MGVPLFVVENGPLLNGFFGDGQGDDDLSLAIGLRRLHRQLQRIEQAAGVAAGHLDEMCSGLRADLDGPLSIAPFSIAQGPLE